MSSSDTTEMWRVTMFAFLQCAPLQLYAELPTGTLQKAVSLISSG
jgi:hypothetical protein